LLFFNEIGKRELGRKMKIREARPFFGSEAQNQTEMAAEKADWPDLERKARVVETALRLYGKGAARQLWRDLGLPEVPGFSRTRLDPPLLADVRAFVDACMARDDCSQLSAGEVHAAYCRWAAATGASRLTLAMFGRLMNHSAIPKRRRRYVTYAARLLDELPGPPLEGPTEPSVATVATPSDTLRDFEKRGKGERNQEDAIPFDSCLARTRG
jgi:hypothetical protein